MSEDLSGLNLLELLDRLEPLPEPSVVSLWPQTEAWIWVGLVMAGLAAWLVQRALLRRRANAYRREALREIASASGSPAALAEILRRTALAAFPRTEVAGLYGDEWLAFLDRTGGLDRTSGLGPTAGVDHTDEPTRHGGAFAFREGVGRVLAEAPYTRHSPESTELVSLVRRWVRGHRNDGRADP